MTAHVWKQKDAGPGKLKGSRMTRWRCVRCGDEHILPEEQRPWHEATYDGPIEQDCDLVVADSVMGS